ncbi:hypothetical protein AVEN_55007-1 [Araneus ventricosus]|uniref:Uncharacterized protein n=1 Tax=Araneus ventricosus TaxID=182803 RepID=A0A4Y2K239_ARAVE|nr:hypothetical protein AVEN_55007-1 [Araneus ventricosus]
MDLPILSRGQKTGTTSELVPIFPNFHITPAGGNLATTYVLACKRPNAWRIFSGIGPRSRDLVTWPSQPRAINKKYNLKLHFTLNFVFSDRKCGCSVPTKVPYLPFNYRMAAAILIRVTSRFGKVTMCYWMKRLTAPPGGKRWNLALLSLKRYEIEENSELQSCTASSI